MGELERNLERRVQMAGRLEARMDAGCVVRKSLE